MTPELTAIAAKEFATAIVQQADEGQSQAMAKQIQEVFRDRPMSDCLLTLAVMVAASLRTIPTTHRDAVAWGFADIFRNLLVELTDDPRADGA